MVKVTSASKKRGRKPAKGPRRGEHVEGAAAVNSKRPQQGNPIEEASINHYLFLRMRKCMRNNAYMQKLGLPVLAQLCANTTISPEKRQQQDIEDSGSEYNEEDNNKEEEERC